MMRVLLADDQAWLRSAIRLLLEQESDIEIIGEVAEVKSLLAKAGVTCPHLVLLDWELPGMTPGSARRQVLAALHAVCPHVHVIVLSGQPEAGYKALAAGADYFVSKADPPESLLAALRQARAASALDGV
jgi:DNA-binding NarL/FixJ family response regulator